MINAAEFAVMMLDLEKVSRSSVDNLFAVACLQYELTMNQLHILIELNKGQEYTVGELSSVIGVLRGNMANICKQLETRGLIERKRDDKDERVVLLHITCRGKILVKEIFMQIQQKYQCVFEKNDLIGYFEKILEGLKALYAFLEQM